MFAEGFISACRLRQQRAQSHQNAIEGQNITAAPEIKKDREEQPEEMR
jgi:hypothetical protein